MESRKRRLLCRTAEVALIVSVALVVPSVALAGDDYTIQTQTGQSIVPGTTDIGNHCDDCVTHVTLPFQVPVYGAPYSSAYVSSNGNIQFLTDNGVAPFLRLHAAGDQRLRQGVHPVPGRPEHGREPAAASSPRLSGARRTGSS